MAAVAVHVKKFFDCSKSHSLEVATDFIENVALWVLECLVIGRAFSGKVSFCRRDSKLRLLLAKPLLQSCLQRKGFRKDTRHANIFAYMLVYCTLCTTPGDGKTLQHLAPVHSRRAQTVLRAYYKTSLIKLNDHRPKSAISPGERELSGWTLRFLPSTIGNATFALSYWHYGFLLVRVSAGPLPLL